MVKSKTRETARADSLQLADTDELAALMNVTPRSVYRYRKEPDFPKPIRLSSKAVRFRRVEIEAWFRKRQQQSTSA